MAQVEDQGQDCESMGCWDDEKEKEESRGDAEEDEVVYAYAPESFWVSKDAELDWLDRNAYLDRKDSGKGTSSGSGNPAAAISQRYSGNLKTKTSLLALPKPQKQNYGPGPLVKNRRQARLFPKRSEPKPNPVLSVNEPGSPKVSCMGRVRSRKDSRRSKKTQAPASSAPTLVRNKSGVAVKHRKSGFWNNFRSIFRSKGHATNSKTNQTSSPSNSNNHNKRAFPSDSSLILSCEPPPTLGGMKRFASGRKSDAWAADVQVVDAPISVPIWRRREIDQPHLLVQRDCRTVGPFSV